MTAFQKSLIALGALLLIDVSGIVAVNGWGEWSDLASPLAVFGILGVIGTTVYAWITRGAIDARLDDRARRRIR